MAGRVLGQNTVGVLAVRAPRAPKSRRLWKCSPAGQRDGVASLKNFGSQLDKAVLWPLKLSWIFNKHTKQNHIVDRRCRKLDMTSNTHVVLNWRNLIICS